jgi:hypothetical protein
MLIHNKMSQYIGVLGRPTTCQRGPGDVRLDNKWNPKWKQHCSLGYDIPGYQARGGCREKYVEHIYGSGGGQMETGGVGTGSVGPGPNIQETVDSISGQTQYWVTQTTAGVTTTYEADASGNIVSSTPYSSPGVPKGDGDEGGSHTGTTTTTTSVGQASSQLYQHPEQFKVFRTKYDYDQNQEWNPEMKDKIVNEYYAPSGRNCNSCGKGPHRTLAFDDPYNYNSYHTTHH